VLSLQDLSNNNRVRLFWVPGHCNIKGNKEADRLARMGSDSYFCGPGPCVPLSASIVRDMNRKWVIDAHSKHWIVLNCCRQSKLWIKHPKLQTTKYLMSLPKKQLKILVSLVTGQCCLNKHLHRIGLTTSPVCASCQLEEGTALHFVCVCPTLATLRTRTFDKPIMNASEFTEGSASAILWFAFFPVFFILLFYLFPSYFSFHFSHRGAHQAQTEARVHEFCIYQEWLHPF
jgi:hypothetical protein